MNGSNMTESAKTVKAVSVTKMGIPDGFSPSTSYQGQILEGGFTRIEISSQSDDLSKIHKALVESFTFPCKMRYLKLTDRQEGQYQNPKSYVAVNIRKDMMLQALEQLQELLYHDGRHQLWILGLNGEQLVLDELGVLYLSPDDFHFRDVLDGLGIPERKMNDPLHQPMSQRDYVLVHFSPKADLQEVTLLQSLGFIQDIYLQS